MWCAAIESPVKVLWYSIRHVADHLRNILRIFLVCVAIPFILDVRLMDVPVGVTQEEGHTGFLHLSSAVLTLIFLARKIQPFLSLVDRGVEFLCTNELIVLHLLGILLFFIILFFVRKIQVRATAPGFELTSERQKVSRLPTEPPGRPASCWFVPALGQINHPLITLQ